MLPDDTAAAAAVIGVQDVRDAIAITLGDGRLNDINPDESLVRSGIISSLEIVLVAVGLSERFATEIPASAVTIANFDTLAALSRLVNELKQGQVPADFSSREEPWTSALASLAQALRRPFVFLILVAVFFALLDRALLLTMKGPLANDYHAFLEHGERLYPVSGGYSTDDFLFSVSQHKVANASKSKFPRVGVFGDSGTIGSWVTHSEAISAQVEAALHRQFPSVEVFNLAFFMQFLAKDLMIMEAAIEESAQKMPFDAVVITLGDDYFSKSFGRGLLKPMPFLALNRDLLVRFSERLPAEARPAFGEYFQDLESANEWIGKPFEEWLKRNTALYHYAPFFRYFIPELPFFQSLNPNYNFHGQFGIGRTSLYSPVPESPPPSFAPYLYLGVREADFDERVRSMLKSTISFLRGHGIKVVIYLKPKGPKEWRSFYPTVGTLDIDIAHDICGGGQCAVVDERWSISGSEFTDSLAHYQAGANQRLGRRIAAVIAEEIKK